MRDAESSSEVSRSNNLRRGLRRVLAGVDGAIIFFGEAAMGVAATCVAAIIALGAIDTAGRAFFSSPLMGTLEITEALLATSIFLALGYAARHGGHVAVDVITQKLGPRARLACQVLGLLVTLAVLVLLSWQGVVSAERAIRAKEITGGYLPVPIPVWLAKSLCAFGLCIGALEAGRQITWLLLRREVAHDEKDDLPSEGLHGAAELK